MNSIKATSTHSPSVFSDDELKLSHRWISVLARGHIGRAIRYRNALKIFLRDVDRLQRSNTQKVMAVDTTEVWALTMYNRPALHAFTFGNLFSLKHDPKITPDHLCILDRLVNHYLFHGQTKPVVILDSYCDELGSIHGGMTHKAAKVREAILAQDLHPIQDLSEKQLEVIKLWLTEQDEQHQAAEWDKFRNIFLPNWRSDLLAELTKRETALGSLSDYLHQGHYVWVRPTSFGERSIAAEFSRLGVKFDWDGYRGFAKKDSNVSRYNQIFAAVRLLLDEARGSARSLTSDADARAFCQLDLLNSYLLSTDASTRIELVSRSPSLHSVLAALPEGRLKVTVRHPMFIPDIYAFDSKSISAVAEIMQRTDAILTPYLDIGNSLVNTNINSRNQVQIAQRVSEVAHDAIPILEDILTIQQSLEAGDKSFFEKVTKRVLTRNSQNSTDSEIVNISASIQSLFAILAQKLRDRDDPFSTGLFQSLVKRNLELARFEHARTFAKGATIKLRTIDFFEVADPRVMPQVFLSVRPVGTAFRRLFHVHSSRIRELVVNSTSPGAGGLDLDSQSPVTVEVDLNKILEQLELALASLISSDSSRREQDIVFNLDATLLACLAFASHNRFDTAVALSTTVLHHMMTLVRGEKLNTANSTVLRERLAHRELFLLRHYCERKLALESFFSTQPLTVDPRSSVSKNFARAQRDLDFAVLMSENIESILNKFTQPPAPAGIKSLMDFRLSLAHLGGWLDQFLIIAERLYVDFEVPSDWKTRETLSVRHRLDAWTAAGMAKEALIVAHRASSLAESSGSKKELRYLAHVEARALQAALTIFCVLLAYPVSGEFHSIWKATQEPTPEKILLFRDWGKWLHRLNELRSTYEFHMRMPLVLEPLFNALIDLEKVRNNTSVPKVEKDADESAILRQMISSMEIKSDPYGTPTTFMRVLVDAIVRRAKIVTGTQ